MAQWTTVIVALSFVVPASGCLEYRHPAAGCAVVAASVPAAMAAGTEAIAKPATAATVKLLAPGDLLHRRFTLAKVDGKDFAVEESAQRPDIEFNEGFQIAGRVCNRFRGPARLEDGRLIAENLAATRMLCVNPELSELEALFFAMLRVGADIALAEDGGLILRQGGRALVYARADWVR